MIESRRPSCFQYNLTSFRLGTRFAVYEVNLILVSGLLGLTVWCFVMHSPYRDALQVWCNQLYMNQLNGSCSLDPVMCCP